MTSDAQARQIESLRHQLAAAMKDRETYIRLTACLAAAALADERPMTADGVVLVPLERWLEVPQTFRVDATQADVVEQPEDGSEPAKDAPVHKMIVVRLEKIEGHNGVLTVPQGPRIVRP